MKTQIAEQQVTPQLAAKIAPDVVNSIGQQKLQAKAIAANKMKSVLDKAFSMAAQKLGGKTDSRVKGIDTASKKIVTKRMEGRDYDIDDLNDMLGIRLVVDKADLPKAIKEVKSMEQAGLFKINKQEEVKDGFYHATHFDLKLPDGNRAEAQIMKPQEEAESTLNHSIRAEHGSNPPAPLKAIQAAQANIAKKLPNNKASQVADAVKQLTKQNNNQSLSPQITAAIASQAQNAYNG